jgi:hypothetical protein
LFAHTADCLFVDKSFFNSGDSSFTLMAEARLTRNNEDIRIEIRDHAVGNHFHRLWR